MPLSPALGCDVALAEIGVTPEQARKYDSDSLNYELGAKTSRLENRLTVNAAVFCIDWKDIQQNVLLQCGFSSARTRAPRRARVSSSKCTRE